MTDKPRDAKTAPGKTIGSAGRHGPDAKASAAGEDHIVTNLRVLFKGVEEEDLPERFRHLLEELAKKERS